MKKHKKFGDSDFLPTFALANENHAEIAQLVERNLAKVEVAGPSPVFRSNNKGRTSPVLPFVVDAGHARSLSARPHGVLPVGCDDELLKEIADICLIQTVLTLYTARLVGYSYFLKAENLKNCQVTGSRNRNQPVCHYEIYCFFITSWAQFWMAFRFAPFSNLPSCHFRSG